MPAVRRTWLRNMVPSLPAPIRPTVTGRPAASRSSSNACKFTSYHLPCHLRIIDDPHRQSLLDAPHLRGMMAALLADRARHERLIPALLGIGHAAFAPHLRRALECRGDVEAVAALKALGLAQRHARSAAIRRAVR